MKVNADKCYLLVPGNYEVSANVNEFEIKSSKNEKLLDISIDTRLSFEHHIISLCKKVACACKNSPLKRLQKTKILNESICNISI